jgi:hypothetical protein
MVNRKERGSMRSLSWRVVGGVLLIVAGILLLLQTFNIFTLLWDVFWMVLLAGGGVVFAVLYLSQGERWWAIIPGMALLALSALVGLSLIGLSDALGGTLFLGALGASFWLVYLRRREHWWAVIPGGVLITLAAVAGVDRLLPGGGSGALFFLGLALTFGLVYLLPTGGERMTWALIPAGVLFVVGLIVTMATSSVMSFVWPAALILVGIYLVLRTVWKR